MVLQNFGGNKMHYGENGAYKKRKEVLNHCVLFVLFVKGYGSFNIFLHKKGLNWGDLYCFYLRLVPLKKWMNK